LRKDAERGSIRARGEEDRERHLRSRLRREIDPVDGGACAQVDRDKQWKAGAAGACEGVDKSRAAFWAAGDGRGDTHRGEGVVVKDGDRAAVDFDFTGGVGQPDPVLVETGGCVNVGTSEP